MSDLPFSEPAKYLQKSNGETCTAVQVKRFMRGTADYRAMEEATGNMYPVGVCDCGRTMRGIVGGCQIHMHVTSDDGTRDDLAIGDWVIVFSKEKVGVEKNSNFKDRYSAI